MTSTAASSDIDYVMPLALNRASATLGCDARFFVMLVIKFSTSLTSRPSILLIRIEAYSFPVSINFWRSFVTL
jgi:hypothetical protein